MITLSLFYKDKVSLSVFLLVDVIILLMKEDPQQKSVALEMDSHTDWVEEVLCNHALVITNELWCVMTEAGIEENM